MGSVVGRPERSTAVPSGRGRPSWRASLIAEAAPAVTAVSKTTGPPEAGTAMPNGFVPNTGLLAPCGATMETPEGKYIIEFKVQGPELDGLRAIVRELIAENPFE